MPAENKLTTFYIARHGETLWNIEERVQGHSDSPLTENGLAQGKMLGKRLKNIHFDAVFSSDLLRAKRTAEIATIDRGLAINTSKLLREQNYGRFEGELRKVFQEKNKELIEQRKKLSREEARKFKLAPDIENHDELCARFITFLREVAVTYPGKTILVISHGGIMRSFLNHLGFCETDLKPGAIENTAHVRIESDGINFFIRDTFGINKEHK